MKTKFDLSGVQAMPAVDILAEKSPQPILLEIYGGRKNKFNLIP